ncbi:hypothetical protein NC651_019495 [Populus alba x Populus x berolinensis]|nr:hypothetical protein NC651_019495 [Populus alba x Populus x berolinensis]
MAPIFAHLGEESSLNDDLGSIGILSDNQLQYDRPPRYPVNPVCKGMDSAPGGSDVLDKIFSGIVAYFQEKPCYNPDAFFSAETLDGWTWRTCSELVMPLGRGNNDNMFLGF